MNSRLCNLAVSAALIVCPSQAQHIIPSALLTIDQNRSTVLERIVGEWGDRLAALKGADPAIRSLGPTAQDFYAAFGLGNNDKTIASLNLEGVALAAIKGLHQTMRQQMREKDKEIARLKRKLQAIEARLGSR